MTYLKCQKPLTAWEYNATWERYGAPLCVKHRAQAYVRRLKREMARKQPSYLDQLKREYAEGGR